MRFITGLLDVVLCRRGVAVIATCLSVVLAFGSMSEAKVRALPVNGTARVTSGAAGRTVFLVISTTPGARCTAALVSPRVAGAPEYPALRLSAVRAGSKGLAQLRSVIPADAPPGRWTAAVACARGARHGRTTFVVGVPRPHQVIQSSLPDRPRSRVGGFGYPRFGAVLVPGADWLGGHGVTVYSNNSCARNSACASTIPSAYGWRWQSVELFERFINTEGWYHGIIPAGRNGGAQNLWRTAPSSAFDKHPNASGYLPVPGDAVIFGGGVYGHVAIVEWVGGGQVGIVEQNASASGRAVLSLSGSSLGGEYGLHVIGVLHATANPQQVTDATASSYEVALQDPTGHLWSVGYDQHGAWPYGLMRGTSPSIAALAGGGFEIAFQANTGHLWIVGTGGTRDTQYEMAPGSSPSITALPDGDFEVAFQGSNGHLWTIGSDMHGDWGYLIRPGTSPSITRTPPGDNGLNYEVAFQAPAPPKFGFLATVGSDMRGIWLAPSSPMMSGTSPSITTAPASPNGLTYEVAFQLDTGSVATLGSEMHGPWGIVMDPASSPTITRTEPGSDGRSYEVAFRGSNGYLWSVGSDSGGIWDGNWGLGMMSATSPSIVATPTGSNSFGYEIAMQVNTGVLWTAGSDMHWDWGLQMMRGTSPSITGQYQDH